MKTKVGDDYGDYSTAKMMEVFNYLFTSKAKPTASTAGGFLNY